MHPGRRARRGSFINASRVLVAEEVDKHVILKAPTTEAQLSISHNKQIQEKALKLMGEQHLWDRNILALPSGAAVNTKVMKLMGDSLGDTLLVGAETIAREDAEHRRRQLKLRGGFLAGVGQKVFSLRRHSNDTTAPAAASAIARDRRGGGVGGGGSGGGDDSGGGGGDVVGDDEAVREYYDPGSVFIKNDLLDQLMTTSALQGCSNLTYYDGSMFWGCTYPHKAVSTPAVDLDLLATQSPYSQSE